ncbi:MAG: sialidase family protein, partial [Acidobacteria bacterium]|nr:sialidase family protein [Acidobacteriota bacterium]
MTKLALVTLLMARPLAAQIEFSSNISLLAVPASAPNTVFLATTTSLYRSDDQGRSYRSVFNSPDSLADLALTTPNTVLLATRSTTKLLYRSTDNGATFTAVILPLPAPPSGTYSISIHPLQSSATTVYLRVGRFLLKSADDGATWTLLSTLFDATSAFAPATTGNRILYAGNAGSPGGFSVSSDDGSTWTQASAVPLPPNSGAISIESVFAAYIIPHPRTPDLLLLNASVSYRDSNAVGGRSTGTSFYRSTDRGRTWNYSGPSGLGSRTVLSREGALLLVAGSNPVRSTDFGLSYTPITNSGPTFFIDGANSSRVWTSNGQVSTDGALSFSAYPRKYFPAVADVTPVELTLEAGSSFANFFG